MADHDTSHTSVDTLDTVFVVPTSKLDADQYSADDLDGVTESIFGSGNMAYASLQASQTDAVLSEQDGFDITGSEGFAQGVAGSGNAASGQNILENEQGSSDKVVTDTDRPFDQGGDVSGSDVGSGNGDFSSSTVGSVSASQLSSDAGAFAPVGSGLNLSEGLSGSDVGANGTDGNTPDVPDIPSGTDGEDGVNVGPGDTVINVDLGDVDMGDVTMLVDVTLIQLGDTVSALTTSLTDVTATLGDVLIDVTNGGVDIAQVTTLVTEITDTLEQTLVETLTDISEVTETLTEISDSVVDDIGGDVLDTVGDTLGDLGGSVTNLNSVINTIVDAAVDPALVTVLETLVETVTPVTVSVDEAVGGALDIIGLGDVLGGPDNGDTDITADLGADAVDVPIVDDGLLASAGDAVAAVAEETIDSVDDGIEAAVNTTDSLLDGVLGGGDADQDDSDVTVDAGVEVIDTDIVEAAVEAVIDPVEDLAGDFDVDLGADLDLLNPADTDNDSGDQDISAGGDVDLVDNDLVFVDQDIEIDFVEAIVGDIDVDAGAALDVMGDNADPLVNDGAGGSGDDSLLADVGEVAEDIAEVVTEPVAGDSEASLDNAIDLLDSSDSDNDAGDSDIAVEADVSVAGIETPDIEADIPLDPAEEIVGDIDLDVEAAIDLLGGGENNAGAGDSEAGDESSWTENTIGDGGLFDDVVDGLGGGAGDALPDPSGTVAEGLGVLDVEPEIDVGSLGGLFG